MWLHPATAANLATLRERGRRGDRARRGHARLPRRGRPSAAWPSRPTSAAARRGPRWPAGERPWDGRRVLVTAGGTREPIDPVRFIGNRSSGRMGIALAAAARAGAGRRSPCSPPTSTCPRPPASAASTSRRAERWPAAAARRVRREPRAGDGRRPRRLPRPVTRGREDEARRRARPRPGADRGHPRRPRGRRTAGRRSSASPPSTATPLARAREKLTRKGADLIVLNDVSNPEIGFESENNAVTLIDAAGDAEVPLGSKDAVAEAILGRVDQLRSDAGQPTR